jgi:hypothetical protein
VKLKCNTMSLDTILKIGKAFRSSDDSLKNFKYVEPCPKDLKGNYPLCISIPVDEDFSVIWNECNITPQKEYDKLYYLKFKTSESDGFVKYIYGDIYYEKSASIKKDGTIASGEGGYYRLSKLQHPNAAFRLSSFHRGTADFNNIITDSIGQGTTILSQFRTFTKNNLELLERMLEYPSAIQYFFLNKNDFQYSFEELVNDEDLLRNCTILQNQKSISKSNAEKINVDLDNLDVQMKSKLIQLTNCRIFLHFDFSLIGKKYWYEYKEVLDIVSKKMLSEFVDKSADGYVLKKALYKTLCSGDKKNDIQFPNFSVNNKYKSKCFINDEVEDLFYALAYTNKGYLISGTDIKMIILPRGQNLMAKDYEDFQEKINERTVIAANNCYDNSLFLFSDNARFNITSFDLIFCKKGGLSSPDKDVIEISCVEKSKLRMIKDRIAEIAKEINNERKRYIGTDKELKALSIEYSFKELLGTPIFKQATGKIEFEKSPMYQSHLLKVLPQIYTDNYFNDEILLPSFIQNVEYSIRSGDNKFKFLKFDLMFLLKIQNNKKNKYMEITESKSYEIGLLLGELAKNISQEINSFEKSYVGTLTRRICNLSDFIKLKTDIEQKLVLHDKSKYTHQISYNLSQKIKEFDSKYDKDECAFGFMESYFKPYTPNRVTNDNLQTEANNN